MNGRMRKMVSYLEQKRDMEVKRGDESMGVTTGWRYMRQRKQQAGERVQGSMNRSIEAILDNVLMFPTYRDLKLTLLLFYYTNTSANYEGLFADEVSSNLVYLV